MRTTLALVLVLATHACPAGAQDISYQRIPIGDRAVGMGGAFTGVAEDLSTVWYNPGGLAFLDGAGVSGALSINILDEYTIDAGDVLGDETRDLNDDGSVTIPLFVGGMAKLGEGEPHERRHAIAGAAVNPSVPSRRFEAGLPPTADGVSAALRVQSRNRLQQYGPAYAYRLNEHFGLGIAGFLSIHSFEYDESTVVNRAGPRQPDGTFSDSSTQSRVSGGDAESISLLFRIGLLWQPSSSFRMGLMLQVPNLPLFRNGRVGELTSTVDATGSGTFSGAEQDTTPTFHQPLELRLGLAYRPRDNWRIALDLSFYGPLGSADDPLYFFGETSPDPVSGVEPDPGQFFSNAIWAKPSFNVAFGTETLIAEVIPLSLGVYTDLSPTGAVEGPTSVYVQPHMDSVGLTAVIGYRKGGYNVAVGGALVLGWGSAYATNPDASAPDAYVPRDARSTSLYIFFTGYSGAAEQLARDVERITLSERELEERRRRVEESERLEELRRECEERLAAELANGETGATEDDQPDATDTRNHTVTD